jgi:predicted O-methyltransferase YrrM
MSQNEWIAVDEYISSLLVQPDAALNETLKTSAAAGLPSINVSPCHGKMLHILARMNRAQNILEIGTLGGYSTIWLARALPANGRLITLEIDPKHAEVAKKNLNRAGVADRVELRLGPALTSLSQIESERRDPFDFIFIDADKPNNSNYFEWALRLSRPGSAIVVDNVVRSGKIVDPQNQEPNVEGVRQLNDMLSREKRVSVTEIQTVGVKGYDGFALAIVNR